MNKTIIICCPGDSFSGDFIKSLTYLIKHLNNKDFKVYFCSAYSRNIYEVRNKCMLGSPIKGPDQLPFNGIEYDYILWIDNDMVFTPSDFDLLYKQLRVLVQHHPKKHEESMKILDNEQIHQQLN